ncbi:MAG: Fic family protein [Verrucomicrobia bacterium]|nr:Fic family protein [Verrucomicrobiota bacterium]MBS0645568.1 Fic family protein [Verrucomicrobiota bacterium]
MFHPEHPFNDIPLLPPQIILETHSVLKACVEANKELAKLKMAERLIPNQSVLINSIPLLESQASSAIENIVTTTDELFEHAEGHLSTVSSATKETLRYRQALYQGYLSLKTRPLSIATVCDICSTIREVDTQVRTLPGTTLMSESSRKKIYTPPEGEALLRQLLTNWQNYLHQNDGIDPLIKLAVQHYQFEAIHPFSDGNGRTGRIVNLLYLIDQGLLDTPILYLSGYIIDHKSQYYEKLLKVTSEGSWIEWVLYFLKAISATSKWTSEKILSIQTLIEESREFIKLKIPSMYSRDLVELLFIQPYVRIPNLIEMGIAKRDTASKYLKVLAEIGFLREIKRGRDKLFINHRFLNLLKQK